MRRLGSTPFLLAALLIAAGGGPAFAQWNQNGSTGPFLYTDTANWVSGSINNTFSTDPTTGLNVYWDADYTMSGALNLSYTGGQNITFRSDSATARTIKMAGNWTRSGGGTFTIGTVANPLILDLNGATRTFGGSTATVNIYAKITNTAGTAGVTLNNGTGYTYLYNNENDFNGPVSFTRRGGGFSSIRNVGAGASALGAPTTAANGLISISDATSFGTIDYTGSGDSSDRNWSWNINSNNSLPFRNTGSGKLTLTGNFTFNSSDGLTFGIQATNADIDLLGVISEGGAAKRSLAFSGGSTSRVITLGSNNTFSGKTTISSVTLVAPSLKNAGATSSLGDATGATATIGIGSTTSAGILRYTGAGDSTNRVIDLAGTTGGATLQAEGTGTIAFTSDFTASGAGSKTLTLSGSNTGNNVIGGAIVDNGGSNRTAITKSGVGTWFLSGTSSFTGGATLTGGMLRVFRLADTNTASSLGTSGTIRMNGGTLTYSGPGDSTNRPFAIGPATSGGGTGAVGAAINASGDGAVTLNGIMDLGNFSNSGRRLTLGGTNTGLNTLASTLTDGQSTFSLSKSDSGRWLVSGANSYTGTTTVSSGTLVAGNNSAFGTGAMAVNGGTLDLGDRSLVVGALTGSSGATITSSSNATATLTTSVAAGSSTYGGTIQNGSGTVGLVKNGVGMLILSASNSYGGGTTLNAGTIELDHVNALGTGTVSFAANAAALMGVSGEVANPVSIAAAVTGTFDTAGQSTTLSGLVSGAGGLVKAGAGSLTLSAASAYAGLTTVSAGTLVLSGLGDIAASSGVNVSALGAGLDISGASGNRTIGSLAGAAGSAVVLGNNSLTAGDATNTTFAGVISGSGGFTKAGVGNLTLSDVQTFTGPARITAGTLAISGTNTLAAASLIDVGQNTILSATTAGLTVVNTQALGGYGTVAGNLTFLNGSILSPGGSVGAITGTAGTTTWNGGMTYVFEVNDATGTPGISPGWDLFTTSGTLTIAGSILNPIIIDLNSLTGSVSGSAANFNEFASYAWKFAQAGSEITTFNAAAFSIDSTGFLNLPSSPERFGVARGDTITNLIPAATSSELYIVVYAAVPEPSTLVLAGMGTAIVAAMARRRRLVRRTLC